MKEKKKKKKDNIDSNTYKKEAVYLGMIHSVDENGRYVLEQKNKFCVNDIIEIMKPDGRNLKTKVAAIYNDKGQQQETAPHSKQELHIELTEQPEIMDILRLPL